MSGRYLETMTWPEAAHELRAAKLIIIPVGARCKEHGHHLPLNTGVSTNWALEPARLELAQENIVMDYTDLLAVLNDVEARFAEQPAGTHADEIETSMMLEICPQVVKLELARRDIDPRGKRPGPLTRDPDVEHGVYSPTGAWGDPTPATCEKGHLVIETLVDRIVQNLTDMASSSFIVAPQRQQYMDG